MHKTCTILLLSYVVQLQISAIYNNTGRIFGAPKRHHRGVSLLRVKAVSLISPAVFEIKLRSKQKWENKKKGKG